jgi:hypothetical protein
MGISLTGLTPATTYDALIKVGDNGPITASLKVLSDGLGTNLPMEASTTGINFTGALQQSGVAVPTAGQVAAKQDTLVSGTNIKTVNSTTILGSGNLAVQDVLVSGTNIKTINGATVLGSGNIVTPSTPPSGVSGAIQFSNGSAFASDAANLFWDDTNNRLGVGTNAPTNNLEVVRNANATTAILVSNSDTTNLSSRASVVVNSGGVVGQLVAISGNDVYMGALASSVRIGANGGTDILINTSGNISMGTASNLGARVGIRGSGSTSATTSLLVQNSAGTQGLKIDDNLGFQIGRLLGAGQGLSIRTDIGSGGGIGDGVNTNFNNGATWNDDTNVTALKIAYAGGIRIANTTRYPLTLGSDTKAVASAQLEMVSTTQGFLPPRGTNTQMNAIASPATGLVFYDTTNNKLCVYNATSWISLH